MEHSTLQSLRDHWGLMQCNRDENGLKQTKISPFSDSAPYPIGEKYIFLARQLTFGRKVSRVLRFRYSFNMHNMHKSIAGLKRKKVFVDDRQNSILPPEGCWKRAPGMSFMGQEHRQFASTKRAYSV